MNNINKNTLNNIDPILSFRDFISCQTMSHGKSRVIVTQEYIPVAESLLESSHIQLTESQICILEFIKENKLNLEKWVLLNEDDWYQQIEDWFNQNIYKPSEKIIKDAIYWLKILGSNLMDAVSSVVSKIMESMKEVWEVSKIDTNSWYLGNKSLKRQVTMSINQQFGAVSESLNENTEVFISELTKESSQLSNMFVESVKNIIEGESFASKVTMSINKFLNESKNSEYSLDTSLNNSVLILLPNAITEGSLKISQFSKPIKEGKIRRFDESYSVNEVFEFIGDFYSWCIEKLESFPPFSWLKEFKDELKNNNMDNMLEGASIFLSKYFGVPGPYQFDKLDPIYSVICSALINFGEYQLIQKLLSIVVFPIPILGPIVSFMLTIYGFFILFQIIFELIENFSSEESENTQMQPTN